MKKQSQRERKSKFFKNNHNEWWASILLLEMFNFGEAVCTLTVEVNSKNGPSLER